MPPLTPEYYQRLLGVIDPKDVFEEGVERVVGTPFSFGQSADDAISQLTAAHPDAPGAQELRRLVGGIQQKLGSARAVGVSILGAKTARPQAYLSVGGEVIRYPLELAEGVVTRGMSVYAARQYQAAKGTIGFSQWITDRILNRVPVSMDPTGRGVGGIVRKALKGPVETLQVAQVHGREIESLPRYIHQQMYLPKSHPAHAAKERHIEAAKSAQMTASDPSRVRPKMEAARQHAIEMQEEVYRSGGVLTGLKWENIAESGHVMAMRQDASLFPGLLHGSIKKGIHQIARVAQLDPRHLSGFRGGVPFLRPIGEQRSFHAPMTIGMIRHPRISELTVGDSELIFTDPHALRAIHAAKGPVTRSLDLHSLGHTAGSRTVETSRALGPQFERLFQEHGIEETLSQHGEWIAPEGKPLSLYPESKGRPILGQSLGMGHGGMLSRGKVHLAPEGYGLLGVKRQYQEGKGFTYRFTFGSEKIDQTMGFLGGGTRRMSGTRVWGIQGMHLLARGEDIFNNLQTRQTTLFSHWASLMEAQGASQQEMSQFGRTLGLTPQTMRGRTIFEGPDDWAFNESQFEEARKLMTKRGVSEEALFGEQRLLTSREAQPIVERLPREMQREAMRELTEGSGLLQFRGYPLAMRIGVGTGLKTRGGMRLGLVDLYYTLAQQTGNTTFDNALRKQAEMIKSLIFANPEFREEIKNLYGPALKYNNTTWGFKTLTGKMFNLEEYAKTGQVPQMRRGVNQGALKGTILDPNWKGGVVQLPKGTHIGVYVGSEDELMKPGFAKGQVFKSDKVYMPSSEMLNLGADERGLYYHNEMTREAGRLDRALRKLQVNPENKLALAEVEASQNNLLVSIRQTLWGKASKQKPGLGRAAPTADPKASSWARLAYLNARPEDRLTVAVTEDMLRKMSDSNKQFEHIRNVLKSGQEYYITGGVFPKHGPAQLMSSMRLRLIEQEELVRNVDLNVLKGTSWDDVVFVDRASMIIGHRDVDLDTWATWLQRSKGHQKHLRTIFYEHDTFFRQQMEVIDEMAKGSKGGWVDPAADLFPEGPLAKETHFKAWVRLAEDKYGIAIPEVFFRTRQRYMQEAVETAKGRGGGWLERAGLQSLANAGLTNEHLAALFSLEDMARQGATDKAKDVDITELMSAIVNTREDPEGTRRTIAAFIRARGRDEKFRQATKFVPDSVHKKGPEAVIEYIATKAQEGLHHVEGAVQATGFADIPTMVYRGRNRNKSVEAVSAILGAELAEGIDSPALIDRIARERGVTRSIVEEELSAINRAAKEGGDLSGGARFTGLGDAFEKFASNLWAGENLPKFIPKGARGAVGKGAFIGAGLLMGQGLFEGFTESDPITPYDMPSGPDARHAPPPQFALGGGSDVRLENPRGAPFTVNASGSQPSIEQMKAMMATQESLGDSYNTGYGYVEHVNRPEGQHELEMYIRDKMRGDF